MQPMASGGGFGATGMRRGYREGSAPANQNGSITVRAVRCEYPFSGSGTLASGTVQAGIVGLNSFDGAGGCDVMVRRAGSGSRSR